MAKKRNKKSNNPKKEFTPITVYVSAFMFGVIGYFAGQFFLGEIHPLHWLTGILGMILGYFLGWRIYHRRGDIFGF